MGIKVASIATWRRSGRRPTQQCLRKDQLLPTSTHKKGCVMFDAACGCPTSNTMVKGEETGNEPGELLSEILGTPFSHHSGFGLNQY